MLSHVQDLNCSKSDEFWNNFNSSFQNKTSSYVDPLKSTDGNATYWQDEDIKNKLWKTFFTGKHLQDNENDFDDDFYFDLHQSYQNLFGNEAYAKSRTITPLDMLNSSINSTSQVIV